MKSSVSVILLGLCTLPSLLAEEAPKPLPIIGVKAARFVDPAAGTVHENQLVIIEGDKVKSIGPVADQTKLLPSDARVIDLGNATVLPGLIDCHTHVTAQPKNYYDDIFRRTPIDVAVAAHI